MPRSDCLLRPDICDLHLSGYCFNLCHVTAAAAVAVGIWVFQKGKVAATSLPSRAAPPKLSETLTTELRITKSPGQTLEFCKWQFLFKKNGCPLRNCQPATKLTECLSHEQCGENERASERERQGERERERQKEREDDKERERLWQYWFINCSC